MSSASWSESGAGHEDLQAAGGDPAARWRALEACRDYLRLVARRGRWSNGNGLPATSDLVQGTIVEAWRQFPRFRGRTPGQLRAWLRTHLIHAALNARRRPRAMGLGSGGDALDAAAVSDTPSRIVQELDERATLDAALDRLTDRHRAVIHMRVWDRSSFARIGAAMGVSEDAARKLYSRAFAALREEMRGGHGHG